MENIQTHCACFTCGDLQVMLSVAVTMGEGCGEERSHPGFGCVPGHLSVEWTQGFQDNVRCYCATWHMLKGQGGGG